MSQSLQAEVVPGAVQGAGIPPPAPPQSGCLQPATLSPGWACRIRNGVRMHPVPRMNMCLVYGPDGDTVHTLNRSAWRLLELCALEDMPRVRATFVRTCSGGRTQAQRLFERQLVQLVALGIVRLEEQTSHKRC